MKKLSLILSMLFVLAVLVVGSMTITSTITSKSYAKENPNATGHIIWDPIDQVFRCVGSPLNCAF